MKFIAKIDHKFIFILALIPIFVALFALPIIDRDEARYAQASKQMVQTGDYLIIKFQDEYRNKKPAGSYWLQTASISFFQLVLHKINFEIFMHRIPSLLAFILSILVFLKIADVFFPFKENKKLRLIAFLLFFTSPIIFFEAVIAKTDIFLLFSCLLSIYGYVKINLASDIKYKKYFLHLFLFWFGILFGFFIKGPITLLIISFIIMGEIIITKSFYSLKKIKPILGIIFLCLFFLPWLYLINNATDGSFLRESFGVDLLSKVSSANENHSGIFTYYILSFFLCFPLFYIFISNINIKNIFKDLQNNFLHRLILFWFLPFLLVIEISSTKLPHYSLPIMPAMGLLLLSLFSKIKDEGTKINLANIIIFNISQFLFLVILLYLFNFFQKPLVFSFVVIMIFLCYFYLSISLYVKNKMSNFIYLTIVTFFTFNILIYNFLPFVLKDEFIAFKIEKFKDEQKSENKYALGGYYEPSAIYYLGTETNLITNEKQIQKYINSGVVLILDDAYYNYIIKQDMKHMLFHQINGFNYAKGKKVNLYFLVLS